MQQQAQHVHQLQHWGAKALWEKQHRDINKHFSDAAGTANNISALKAMISVVLLCKTTEAAARVHSLSWQAGWLTDNNCGGSSIQQCAQAQAQSGGQGDVTAGVASFFCSIGNHVEANISACRTRTRFDGLYTGVGRHSR